MIGILSGLNATKNLWLAGILIVLGGAIVAGIFQAGVRHERNKVSAATAVVNTKLASLNAKDRAELEAEAERAKAIDATVAASVKQSLILTEETAALLSSIR